MILVNKYSWKIRILLKVFGYGNKVFKVWNIETVYGEAS